MNFVYSIWILLPAEFAEFTEFTKIHSPAHCMCVHVVHTDNTKLCNKTSPAVEIFLKRISACGS